MRLCTLKQNRILTLKCYDIKTLRRLSTPPTHRTDNAKYEIEDEYSTTSFAS